jgi:hypothetical protein
VLCDRANLRIGNDPIVDIILCVIDVELRSYDAANMVSVILNS